MDISVSSSVVDRNNDDLGLYEELYLSVIEKPWSDKSLIRILSLSLSFGLMRVVGDLLPPLKVELSFWYSILPFFNNIFYSYVGAWS